MRLPEEPDLPPQINIVPMIDVIFAILTFFMMSSLVLGKSEGLPLGLNLPNAQTSRQTGGDQAPILLSLNAKSQLRLNNQPVQLANLADQVRTLMGNRSQVVVALAADRAVPHGEVIQVMDQLRQVRGVRLSIKTTRQ
jgi:biopolymer transport protein ExbD